MHECEYLKHLDLIFDTNRNDNIYFGRFDLRFSETNQNEANLVC